MLRKGLGNSQYQINVSGNSIPVDIRTLGDNYYDPLWQRICLKGRYFIIKLYLDQATKTTFSLLYHCKPRKERLKINM